MQNVVQFRISNLIASWDGSVITILAFVVIVSFK